MLRPEKYTQTHMHVEIDKTYSVDRNELRKRYTCFAMCAHPSLNLVENLDFFIGTKWITSSYGFFFTSFGKLVVKGIFICKSYVFSLFLSLLLHPSLCLTLARYSRALFMVVFQLVLKEGKDLSCCWLLFLPHIHVSLNVCVFYFFGDSVC